MLRMTKQADYGIVLMTYLASHAGRLFAAPELAAETQLPLPTVSKVLKLLSRGSLLESHRGAKGGYSLARDPRQITVAAMISTLDGPIAFTECIEDTPGVCSQESVCRLRGNWQRINEAVRQALESITLAELTDPLPSPLVQLGPSDQATPPRSLSY
ncbi:MAG: SUF system Fe-S cluster assembly regulator [bacterium]|nr:SUF system Fe-S cluster assembly regulator [bacterium]